MCWFPQRSMPGCVETGDFVQLLGGNGIDTSKLLPITDLCISFSGPSEYTLITFLLFSFNKPTYSTNVYCFFFFFNPQLTWRSAVITRWWGWCPVGNLSTECLSVTSYWTTRNYRRSNLTMWRISVSITDQDHKVTNVSFYCKYLKKIILLKAPGRPSQSIWLDKISKTQRC